jgi:hypothetical protein
LLPGCRARHKKVKQLRPKLAIGPKSHAQLLMALRQ